VSERTVNTSGRIVLRCSRCTEYIVLLGLVEDWLGEHRSAFECCGCAKTLTLADRIVVERPDPPTIFESLMRSSIQPPNFGA
jgi:hypothetical protein